MRLKLDVPLIQDSTTSQERRLQKVQVFSINEFSVSKIRVESTTRTFMAVYFITKYGGRDFCDCQGPPLGGGSNEVLSYSCHIHMIAILACIYGDMSNAVSWSSTLCGAPKQSKLGIAVFIYGMICSKTHHCSNELPSYIYDFDFGLFLN